MSEHYCPWGKIECWHWHQDICSAKWISEVSVNDVQILFSGKCPWPSRQKPIALSEYDRGRIAGQVEMKEECLKTLGELGVNSRTFLSVDSIPVEPA